ncbi:MAG: response regulator [Rhodospirillales bacterium]|nr:MAG: response regulator [Rhodospirillales bacterium]
MLLFAGLAVLFVASFAGLVGQFVVVPDPVEEMPVPVIWIGLVVLTAAGLGFLAAHRFPMARPDTAGAPPTMAAGRSFMESLPLGLAIYDATGRLEFFNDRWRAMFADVEKLTTPGSRHADAAILAAPETPAEAAADGYSKPRQLDSGTWVRLARTGLPDGRSAVTAFDVTGDHARWVDAESERDRSRLIISAAGAWIWETDVLHRFSLATSVRSEVSQEDLGWMIGRSVDELASAAGTEDEEGLAKCVDNMQAHRRLTDARLILHDGARRRAIRLSGVPRIDDDGVFLGYCGVGLFEAIPADTSREDEAPKTVALPRRDTAQARGQRVLLVDDSQTNRLLGVSILKKMGYECDAVESGQQAVDAVNGGLYGIVLMDIRMPGMDGFEATSQIRDLPAPDGSIPIVAMTAHMNAEDRQLCLDSGMDEHVSKPVDRRMLSSVLERLIGPPVADDAGTAEDAAGGAGPNTEDAGPADGDDGGAEDPASPPGDAALADRDTLEQLRNDAGPELLGELIASFMTETDERLKRMQTATEAGDLDSVSAEAHALKSSSGTFGALRLQRLVERLEAAAAQSDAGLTTALMTELPELVAESWQEFNRAGYPPPG